MQIYYEEIGEKVKEEEVKKDNIEKQGMKGDTFKKDGLSEVERDETTFQKNTE